MGKSSSEISDAIVDGFERKLHLGLEAAGGWLRMKIHEAVKEEQDRTRDANLQVGDLKKAWLFCATSCNIEQGHQVGCRHAEFGVDVE